jgi:hypothetical protein
LGDSEHARGVLFAANRQVEQRCFERIDLARSREPIGMASQFGAFPNVQNRF